MPDDFQETTQLHELSKQVLVDLELLDHPKKPWLVKRHHHSGAPVFDVIIIGAGQSGLALSFALKRENIDNVIAIDSKPEGKEGPWNSYARMQHLRTALNLTGPDLGIPSLTPRAWYTAKYGSKAWHELERFPTLDWHQYLTWYRSVLNIPVWNETEVGPLGADEPNSSGSLIKVPLKSTGVKGKDGIVFAREVILANGLEGCGEWYIPELIKDALPQDRYSQANHEIDFNIIKGKRIAVLGANAGAFDNAATALEAGAKEAHVFVRRPEIAKINAHKPFDDIAYLKHFAEFSDLERWRIAVHILQTHQPPPQESFDRALALKGFRMHENAAWKNVSISGVNGNEILIETYEGHKHLVDFIIAATGHINDFSLRAETSLLSDKIALWADRFVPLPGEESLPASSYPYLGRNFEFIEKNPGEAPYLHHIHCFTIGTLISLGMTGSSVTTMRYGIPRIIEGVTRQLFLDDKDYYLQTIMEHDEIDLIVPSGEPKG